MLSPESTSQRQVKFPTEYDALELGTDELKNKGWEYKMEGQFLEIVRVKLLFSFLAYTDRC